ncbi:MAG: hypothetical protein K2Z81_15180, partial [Cyanobacteria bacterium]|nr:hypothetical protein [Cyanobacteriota bacterium]
MKASHCGVWKLRGTISASLVVAVLGATIQPSPGAGSEDLSIEANNRWANFINAARERGSTHGVNYAIQAIKEAKNFGVDDPRYSISLRLLSRFLIEKGRFHEAEPYLKEEMSLLEKMGPYPGLDFDLFWLATLSEEKGNFTEAEQMLKRALKLCLRYPKREEPDPAVIYARLSAIAFALGRVDDGRNYARLSADHLFHSKRRTGDSINDDILSELRDVNWHTGDCRKYLFNKPVVRDEVRDGRLGRIFYAYLQT